MQYVCHQRYRKKGACGRKYFFKPGDILESIGPFIAKDNREVCSRSSDDAFRYFARNDDGHGMERGELTYSVAYAERHPNKENGYRFTPEEIGMLEREYPQYLVPGIDVILFNADFFNADISVLREIKNRLEERKCMQ